MDIHKNARHIPELIFAMTGSESEPTSRLCALVSKVTM
jgi:hypothetical protein